MNNKMRTAAAVAAGFVTVGVLSVGALEIRSAFNKHAAYEAGYQDYKDKKALEAITDLSRDHRYIILGDTNHEKISISDFVLRRETVDALAAANFKFVALEYTTSMQPVLDAFVNGEIQRRDFITATQVITNGYSAVEYDTSLKTDAEKLNRVESLADFIQAATEKDIRVLFVDGREGYPQATKDALVKQGERYLAFARYLRETPEVYANDPQAFLVKHFQRMRPDLSPQVTADIIRQSPTTQEFVSLYKDKDLYQFVGEVYRIWIGQGHLQDIAAERESTSGVVDDMAFIAQRLREDEAVAQRIKDLTNNEKTLVLYGSGHTTHDSGNLAELLDNAPTLLMFNEMDEYGEFLQLCYAMQVQMSGCAIKDNHSLFLFSDGIVVKAPAFDRGFIAQAAPSGAVPNSYREDLSLMPVEQSSAL